MSDFEVAECAEEIEQRAVASLNQVEDFVSDGS
jgi:hypothetical protein